MARQGRLRSQIRGEEMTRDQQQQEGATPREEAVLSNLLGWHQSAEDGIMVACVEEDTIQSKESREKYPGFSPSPTLQSSPVPPVG